MSTDNTPPPPATPGDCTCYSLPCEHRPRGYELASHYAPAVEPATPGGEVAGVLRRIDWLYQHTPRECVHDDVHRQARDVVERLTRKLTEAQNEARHLHATMREQRRALAASEEARAKAEEARDERDEELAQSDDTRGRMRAILDAVAVAVRGPAPDGVLHDWSRLPAEVDRLRTDLAARDAELATARERLGTATGKHPRQPVIVDKLGVHRFKANRIVEFLLDWAKPRGVDMNALAIMRFDDEDREQFAQLIGYSVSGACDLSYMSDEVCNAALAESEALSAARGATETPHE